MINRRNLTKENFIKLAKGDLPIVKPLHPFKFLANNFNNFAFSVPELNSMREVIKDCECIDGWEDLLHLIENKLDTLEQRDQK